MPRFKLMRERTTHSVVFKSEAVRLLQRFAAARQRSLSRIVREAVARLLEDEARRQSGWRVMERGSETA